MFQHDNSSWPFYPMMTFHTKCRLFKQLKISTFLTQQKKNKIMRVCVTTIHCNQDLLPYLFRAVADGAGQRADRLVEAGRGEGGPRLRVAHHARVKGRVSRDFL